LIQLESGLDAGFARGTDEGVRPYTEPFLVVFKRLGTRYDYRQQLSWATLVWVREWLSGELRQFRSSVATGEDCPRVNLDFQSYISGMDLLTMRVEFSAADVAE
jgi:hypothetical protein